MVVPFFMVMVTLSVVGAGAYASKGGGDDERRARQHGKLERERLSFIAAREPNRTLQ
jgi:hypothetical protein